MVSTLIIVIVAVLSLFLVWDSSPRDARDSQRCGDGPGSQCERDLGPQVTEPRIDRKLITEGHLKS